ncbi:hypothetical protein F4803DRAFT_555314 [Xylaria telfairii]|nr:hypothetical protein F4803DRAFT_555314 [Xylaria telfairii]
MVSPETEDQDSRSEELPLYVCVEDVGGYVAGGLHPIHLGDKIGPDERFEVHHKLGYSDACTMWLCLDSREDRRVCVKVFRAEKSVEPHPEIEALYLFEGIDRDELQSNRISTMDEHFWIDGSNGYHLCFVMQVLGPPINYGLKGIGLDTPDLLGDLCLQALPKNSDVWSKFQEQRERLTGFPSLLHENLSKERQWYMYTDALNGEVEDRLEILPSSIDDATLRQLNGTWVPESGRTPAAEEPAQIRGTRTAMANNVTVEATNSNGKRPFTEEDQDGQPKLKKVKTFVAEHNLRDQVERVDQYDGMTKFSYRLQPEEVKLLCSLLQDMLKNDPEERITIDEVLQHGWFELSRKRLGSI